MNFILLTIFLSSFIIQVAKTDENNNYDKSYFLSLFMDEFKDIGDVLILPSEKTGNEMCDEHLRLLRKSSQNKEPWALQMTDASSKLFEGDLDGNLLNLGNFEECINVEAPEKQFFGKYCLTFLSIAANSSVYDSLRYMRFGEEKSQYFAKENVLLFGPQIAVCIPSSCTAANLQNAMNTQAKKQNLTSVYYSDDKACVMQHDELLDTSDWITIGILCIFLVLVVASTCYDVTHKNTESQGNIFVTFSLYTNSKKLFSTRCNKYLHCLHGIRFITCNWILVGHVYLTVFSQSSSFIRMLFDFESWHKIIISNSYPSVDTFLLLSGLLLCYSFLSSMEKKKLRDFNVVMFYFLRYMRLTPVLAMLILISATILRRVGSGPMWEGPYGMYAASQLCRERWWQPLLYIQNYMSKPSCIMQSWYLAVDNQLYVLSPIVLILIWKRPKLGILVLIFLALLGVVIIFLIAFIFKEHLPFTEMARYVTLISKFEDARNLESVMQNNRLFVKTHARYVPWVIGILLGYALYKTKDKTIKISKIYVAAGWICSLCLIWATVAFAHPLLQLHYEYNVWEVSTYLALHKLTWSIGVSWVIFACASGYGGIINTFLSLPAWLPFSRLTYCMYFLHLTLLELMSFSVRDKQDSTDVNAIFKCISVFITSTAVSIIFSLIFESPVIQITKLLFKDSIKQNKSLEESPKE